MKIFTLFSDLATIPYQEALEYQEKLFKEVLYIKACNQALPHCEKQVQYHHLIFCEHPHVYTLGKSGNDSNLLIDSIQLKTKKAEFVKTNRGGDITYHGPGQLVGYPILDLESLRLGTRQYIEKMESALMLLLRDFGIESYIKNDAIGVWLAETKTKPERKIAAIGVKISRFVSMHGFALNVNTNMDYFSFINPCGFVDKGVSSMAEELGREINMALVKNKLRHYLSQELNLNLYNP